MRRSEQFGRTPKVVLTSPDISDRAARIYGILAMSVFQGNVARIGIRRLAEMVNCSRASAHRAIKELIAAEFIKTGTLKAGERAFYVLTSSIFGQKQRDLDAGETITEDLVSFPRKRLATVRKSA